MLVRTICDHQIRVVPGSVRIHRKNDRDMYGPVADVRVTAECVLSGRRYEVMAEEIPLDGSRRFRARHTAELQTTLDTARKFAREYHSSEHCQTEQGEIVRV